MKWRDIIQGENVYEKFPHERFLENIEGWGHDSPVFEDIIKAERPEKIIEVGTWFGASAIAMADLLVKYGIDGEIICVDTWLGTADNWLHWARPVGNYGHPLHYFQFLTNVKRRNHCERITPLPIDSHNAAMFFTEAKLAADMIYIDASHDYVSVKSDIADFWPVLKGGGVMVGDDYSKEWPGVVRAVDEFSAATGIAIDTNYPGKWIARKPV